MPIWGVRKMLLQLDDIHVSYGYIEALRGIYLNVGEGEIVTLLGANGAGKTTTLMTISGVLRPLRGTVIFQGKPIQGLAPSEIVKIGISQTPEGRGILARMTVEGNLEMGAFIRKDSTQIRQDLKWVYSIFPILQERQEQKGGTLSGGEQQMLAIGRSLMSRPTLLVLDEPSLGLAPLVVRMIFHVLREINRRGTSILLVEQNARMALAVAKRGYVLEEGKITLEGLASELMREEKVRQAYLGEEVSS
jgi:branched-chain amino acid transport system ATP-binding protein